MAKVLTQEEVDSLLNGIGEGTVETETDVPVDDGETLQPYDFSGRSGGPYHLKLPALGIINERFISSVNASLTTLTSAVIDVNVSDIDSVKFGDFCRSLPLPTSLNMFRMAPLRGLGLVVLEGSLVFAFVDTIFGGKCEGHVKLEGKSFTHIETRIIQKVITVVLEDYQKAWADIYPLTLKQTRMEIDPQFAGIAKPGDMVIATRFTVDIGNFSGTLTVCMPYANLEPIKDVLRDSFKSERLETDFSWKKQIEDKIREQALNVNCVLGRAVVTGRELLRMQPGDVIVLDQKVRDEINVTICGIKKFSGFPGNSNNRKAVRLEKRYNAG